MFPFSKVHEVQNVSFQFHSFVIFQSNEKPFAISAWLNGLLSYQKQPDKQANKTYSLSKKTPSEFKKVS